MRKQDFDFDLPEALIAQEPLSEREASRLLHLQRAKQTWQHRQFTDVVDLLQPGDLLVFNDTRVIPARLFAQKPTGGKVEVFLERFLDTKTFLAQCRSAKPLKPGLTLLLEDDRKITLIERQGTFWQCVTDGDAMACFVDLGAMPLPPYIKRPAETFDEQRYQTVFCQKNGAVAAPTAGLHFSQALLAACQAKGVESVFVTLHIAAGTFAPMRVENIFEHQMHREYLEVKEEAANRINAAKQAGRRIIAVGTTAVRVLETVGSTGVVKPFSGDTDIFIYPGYHFQIISGLITNFHLPQSTLLMLVSAFAGRDCVLRAYADAVAQRYRFFSYGDAMFIE